MNKRKSEVPVDPPSEKKRQISTARNWCWTLNNPTEEEIKLLLDKLKEHRYSFQEEKGAGGTSHLQGWTQFKERVRPSGYVGIPRVHWEKMKGTEEQAIAYTRKADTRSGGQWTNLRVKRKPIDRFPKDEAKWYAWQKALMLALKEEPDERTIHWVCGPPKVGKSVWAKHMLMQGDAMCVGGKGHDIRQAVRARMDDPKAEDLRIVIVNLGMSDGARLSYVTLEQLKDGFFFSGKYEGTQVVMADVHVVVLANYPPLDGGVALDRFVLYDAKAC